MICTTLCLFPTATLFLENLAKEGCLSDQALLLSVYPLTVGRRLVWGRKVQDCFSEYRPPDQQNGVRYVRRVLIHRVTPVYIIIEFFSSFVTMT